MAGSVNKVILVGNLGRDPEVRHTQDGTKIVHLAIATSERWRDRTSGENRERTEWHRVVIFNERLGEVAEKYLAKGRSVYLEGQLQTRKWQDQSGQERYSTEVVLQRFRGELVLLGGRDEGLARRRPTSARATGAGARPSRRGAVSAPAAAGRANPATSTTWTTRSRSDLARRADRQHLVRAPRNIRRGLAERAAEVAVETVFSSCPDEIPECPVAAAGRANPATSTTWTTRSRSDLGAAGRPAAPRPSST